MDETDGGGGVRRHCVAVRNRKLRGLPISIVSRSVRSDVLDFDLDGEFGDAGAVSIVVYPLDGGWAPLQARLDGDGAVTLPDDAYGSEGWLGMALVAESDETGEVITTVECRHAIRVLPSAIGALRGGQGVPE